MAALWPEETSGVVTFGEADLCVMDPSEPVTITRVEPLEPIYGSASVTVLLLDTSAEDWFYSVAGPPSSVYSEGLSEAVGGRVNTSCSDTSSSTHLVLTFNDVGSDGAGWRGVRIEYSVGDAERSLILDYSVAVCPRNLANEICAAELARPAGDP